MAFERMKGVEGLVYVPEDEGRPKKYPCEDCHFCQWCSDNRCTMCLESKSCNKTLSGPILPPDCIKSR